MSDDDAYDVKLTSYQRRVLAVAAMVGDRTVKRFLAGQRVQVMVRERIQRAARDLGLPLPLELWDERR